MIFNQRQKTTFSGVVTTLFTKVQSLPEQHLAVLSVTVLGRFFSKAVLKNCFYKRIFEDFIKALFNYQGSRSRRRSRDDQLIISHLFKTVNSFFLNFSNQLLKSDFIL